MLRSDSNGGRSERTDRRWSPASWQASSAVSRSRSSRAQSASSGSGAGPAAPAVAVSSAVSASRASSAPASYHCGDSSGCRSAPTRSPNAAAMEGSWAAMRAT